MNALLNRASIITGYTIEDITSHCRERHLTMVRHCLMWTLRNKNRVSLKVIGKMFGRDHTTILHACEKVEGYLKYNDDMYMPIHESIVDKFYTPINSGKPCAQCTYEISKQRT